MNFYASPEYLDVLAEVYFARRRTRVADVRIGQKVLRLLEVDRKRLITRAQFLDYHEPLRDEEIHAPIRAHGFAECVSRGIVELTPGKAEDWPGFELAPFVDWSRFPSFDDYRAFITAHHRGLVRERERRGRRLAEVLGEPEFRMDDPEEDVLLFARRWKSRQLRQGGLADYFSDAKTLEYFRTLRARGLLTSSSLRASGRLLAIWIGFVFDCTWSGWVFTYDPELAKYSPGHQLLSRMLEESHRRGHRAFDFSTGAENYKMLYATHGRLLSSIGRLPLERRIVDHAKARLRSSRWFPSARAVKRAIETRSLAPAATVSAPPSAFDTGPPLEGAPPRTAILGRAKASASSLVLPLLQRVARDHVGGETIEDALLVARRLGGEGASSTLGFWETRELVGRSVADAYLAAVGQLAGLGLDSTLSIKPPAMRFDHRWAAELAALAERLGVRIHCDSHGPEVADRSHEMERAMLDHMPGASLSTTLPGRWTRSLSDAERVIAGGLGVRVVKGQWPDPLDPKRDARAGFLEVIDRLAGRVRHVGVATHDVPLASEAIARLRAAGTPCELELLFGRPMSQALRWARQDGVRLRIYVPFGRGYIPSAIGILRRNPQLALRIVQGLLADGWAQGLAPRRAINDARR